MAYDSDRGQVIMTYDSYMWEWDGAAWTQINFTGESYPNFYQGHAIAYDRYRQVLVYYYQGNTYEYDNGWSQKSPETHPGYNRQEHAMAYDPITQKILLFGGEDGSDCNSSESSSTCDDTWTWDGTDWEKITTSTSPAPRRYHQMVLDETLGQVVLFGGSSDNADNYNGENNTYFNDSWAFNGTKWEQLDDGNATPRGRSDFAMAYHPFYGAVIAYGGYAYQTGGGMGGGDSEQLRGELSKTWVRRNAVVGAQYESCVETAAYLNCGNGVLDGDEACDCGDGAQNPDSEACPMGGINNGYLPGHCRLDCTLPICGDGILDDAAGESCDDGNHLTEFCLPGEESCVVCNPDCLYRPISQNLICGADIDLGLRLGTPLFAGSTTSFGDDTQGDCASTGEDMAFVWQPPKHGSFKIHTGDSADDVSLTLLSADETGETGVCTESECSTTVQQNDGETRAQIIYSTEGGEDTPERVLLVIEGGSFELHIESVGGEDCGDGVEDGSETCDEGEANSDTAPDACRKDCSQPYCGDGIIDLENGEGCDEGLYNGSELNNPTDCSSDCAYPLCEELEPLPAWEDSGHVWGETSEHYRWVKRAGCAAPDSTGDVIIFGQDNMNCSSGYGGSYICNSEDTWRWDGINWNQAQTNDGFGDYPSNTSYCVMAYHAAISETVMIANQQTWLWSGSEWEQQTNANTNFTGAMAYDPTRELLVAVSGYGIYEYAASESTDGGTAQNSIWNSITPGPSDSADGGVVNLGREDHAMAYDPLSDRIIVFGGQSSGGNQGDCNVVQYSNVCNDTWAWDGTAWEEVNANGTKPPARKNHAMVYDEAFGKIIMFGGHQGDSMYGETYFNDLWAWNGDAWEEITDDAAGPRGRRNFYMAYHPNSGKVVIYGGEVDTNGMDWEVEEALKYEMSQTWLRTNGEYDYAHETCVVP